MTDNFLYRLSYHLYDNEPEVLEAFSLEDLAVLVADNDFQGRGSDLHKFGTHDNDEIVKVQQVSSEEMETFGRVRKQRLQSMVNKARERATKKAEFLKEVQRLAKEYGVDPESVRFG